jgi:hypothetical protein
MALLFPFMVAGLAQLATTDDDEEATALARRIRTAILTGATDTNPKRTRATKAKRARTFRTEESA